MIYVTTAVLRCSSVSSRCCVRYVYVRYAPAFALLVRYLYRTPRYTHHTTRCVAFTLHTALRLRYVRSAYHCALPLHTRLFCFDPRCRAPHTVTVTVGRYVVRLLRLRCVTRYPFRYVARLRFVTFHVHLHVTLVTTLRLRILRYVRYVSTLRYVYALPFSFYVVPFTLYVLRFHTRCVTYVPVPAFATHVYRYVTGAHHSLPRCRTAFTLRYTHRTFAFYRYILHRFCGVGLRSTLHFTTHVTLHVHCTFAFTTRSCYLRYVPRCRSRFVTLRCYVSTPLPLRYRLRYVRCSFWVRYVPRVTLRL